MEKIVDLTIEKLEEDGKVYYLVTSEDVQGLVAQGETIEEAVSIAKSLVVDLRELRQQKNRDNQALPSFREIPQIFHYPLIFEA